MRERRVSVGELFRETGIRVSNPRRRSTVSPYIAPMPLAWVGKAAMLGGRALHVAVACWHQSRLERKRTIALSTSRVRQFGVTPKTALRALRRLEAAGLLSVETACGRCPRVTIRATGGSAKRRHQTGH